MREPEPPIFQCPSCAHVFHHEQAAVLLDLVNSGSQVTFMGALPPLVMCPQCRQAIDVSKRSCQVGGDLWNAHTRAMIAMIPQRKWWEFWK